jgi:hypothetical protein
MKNSANDYDTIWRTLGPGGSILYRMDVTYTSEDGDTPLFLLIPSQLTFTPSLPQTWSVGLNIGATNFNMYMYNSTITQGSDSWKLIPVIAGVMYLSSGTTLASWNAGTPTWANWSPNKSFLITFNAPGLPPGSPSEDLVASGPLNFSSSGPLPTTGTATFNPSAGPITALRIYFYLLI